MKRKIAITMLFTAMSLSLVACGSAKSSQSEAKSETETVLSEKVTEKITEAVAAETAPTTEAPSQKDLPDGDYSDTGSGTMQIATPGGTSEDGNIPVLYVDQSTYLMQIGLDAWEFDGGKLSYIYLDGMLTSKEQLSDTQMSLDLSDDALSEGIHLIEVVQYDGDSTEGQIVTYKSASYEIKSK